MASISAATHSNPTFRPSGRPAGVRKTRSLVANDRRTRNVSATNTQPVFDGRPEGREPLEPKIAKGDGVFLDEPRQEPLAEEPHPGVCVPCREGVERSAS